MNIRVYAAAAVGITLVAAALVYVAYRDSGSSKSVQVLGGSERFGIDANLFPGERVLVNFFASWCGPCREEHPYLLELAEQGEFRVVGIAVMDVPDNALAYLEEHGSPFEIIGADPNREVSLPMGVSGIPYTLLLDEHGEVVSRLAGPINPERMETLLK